MIYHVPCGHCYECVRKRKLDWEIRLNVEHSVAAHTFFCMLTYNDECYHSEPDPTEISYFIKRLRYNLNEFYPGCKLKYFIASELGELKDRLHYHCLFFLSEEFDDHAAEFEELLKLSWVRKVPLTDDEISFRKSLYRIHKNRLSPEKSKELFNWSRRKYDDISIGFATAQVPRHGTGMGSIHYCTKYIQKQYNKMFYSQLGYKPWREYMVKSGYLIPNWNRPFSIDIGSASYLHLYECTLDKYPMWSVRGKLYPVPVRWMLNTVGKFHTVRLRNVTFAELRQKEKNIDFQRLQSFWHSEPERDLKLSLMDYEVVLARRRHFESRNDFDNTLAEWQMSTTLKQLLSCPVEIVTNSITETLLPLKWPS